MIHPQCAPIVLFTYSRPLHVRRVIEALKANKESLYSDLIIYSDAPREAKNIRAVLKVREYIKSIDGFKSIRINERPYNFGLANSLLLGISEVLREYESIIVIEDDIEVSPEFLSFMNTALTRYCDDMRVVSISGYVYPTLESVLPDTFFLLGADCWGWATWRRAWSTLNVNAHELIAKFDGDLDFCRFNFGNSYPFEKMLKRESTLTSIDSWAILWYASSYTHGLLTLYPGKSLVRNIGNDGSGVHGSYEGILQEPIYGAPFIGGNDVVDSEEARKVFQSYLGRRKSFFVRFKSALNRYRDNFIVLSKYYIKLILPPIFLRAARIFTPPSLAKTYFIGPYAEWAEAQKNSIGYENELIFNKTLEAAIKVRDGLAVFERDSILFHESNYSIPIALGILRAAAVSKGALSVLDFGGSLGSTFYRHFPLFQGFSEVLWGIVDQRRNVENGQKHFQGENLKFFKSVKDLLFSNNPNIAIFSGVLQYLDNPYDVLREVIQVRSINTIVIDRVTASLLAEDFFAVQKVSPLIYDGSYPMRIFSLGHLRSCFGGNWILIHEEISAEGVQKLNSGIEFSHYGYVYLRVN